MSRGMRAARLAPGGLVIVVCPPSGLAGVCGRAVSMSLGKLLVLRPLAEHTKPTLHDPKPPLALQTTRRFLRFASGFFCPRYDFVFSG